MCMHSKVAPGCGFNKHVTPNWTKGLWGKKQTNEYQVMIIRNKQVHLDIPCIKAVKISKRLAPVWPTAERMELLMTQFEAAVCFQKWLKNDTHLLIKQNKVRPHSFCQMIVPAINSHVFSIAKSMGMEKNKLLSSCLTSLLSINKHENTKYTLSVTE